MKILKAFSEIPELGADFSIEGTLLRVYFNITLVEKAEGVPNIPNLCSCDMVEIVNDRSYGDIVSAIVNDQYDADDTQALYANLLEARDAESDIEQAKREEYITEYTQYQQFRKKAKEIAKFVVEQLSE